MDAEELIKDGITFFVPCLNEEGNVGGVIDTLARLTGEMKLIHEVIVVDDASTDGTVAEIEAHRQRYPQNPIRIIRNAACRGLGRNYLLAAQQAQMEYFMLVTGDASEPEEALRTILLLKGQADAIVPYYIFDKSKPLPRRLLSRLFTGVVNVLSGNRLHYYNGVVLHRTQTVRRLSGKSGGFGYQAELLCRLLREGSSIKEIQVGIRDRKHGTSKALSLGNGMSVAGSLIRIAVQRFAPPSKVS